MPGEEAALAAPGVAAKKKVALFVAHGVGQQVPFETMDMVAEGLARVAKLSSTAPGNSIRTVTGLVAGKKLQRIEMDLPAPGDGPGVEVHIYEGYWAPFTEGQVTLRDVVSFLLRGGVNGALHGRSKFHRWIFGGLVDFGIRRKTSAWLLLALGVLLALIGLNLLVAAVFGDRVVGRMSGLVEGGILTQGTFTALTTLVAGWVIYSVVVGLLLYATHAARPRLPDEDRPGSRLWTGLLHLLLLAWVFATIALGIVVALAMFGIVELEGRGLAIFSSLWVVVWGALLAVSWLIRGLMVQFPGDLAAYIASHTLDRFCEIRARIKAEINSVAKAIYASASPEYDGIVWVGHSLGSVVAYDALNTLIIDDELAEAGQRKKVVERTRLLVTFGSPLDKIAFIFATQWTDTTTTREALAASFQPLILDYERFRRIRWVNIHSPSDIISGPLEFFDDRKKEQHKALWVDNVPDPAASTPLFAHVEYWKNRLLYERIYEGLVHEGPKQTRNKPATIRNPEATRAA